MHGEEWEHDDTLIIEGAAAQEIREANERVTPAVKIEGIGQAINADSVKAGPAVANAIYEAEGDRFIFSNYPLRDFSRREDVSFWVMVPNGKQAVEDMMHGLPEPPMLITKADVYDPAILGDMETRAKQHNAALIGDYLEHGGKADRLTDLPEQVRPCLPQHGYN